LLNVHRYDNGQATPFEDMAYELTVRGGYPLIWIWNSLPPFATRHDDAPCRAQFVGSHSGERLSTWDCSQPQASVLSVVCVMLPL
jgi:hypothetical protein